MASKNMDVPDGDGPLHIVRYGNRKLYVERLGYVEMPFLKACFAKKRPIVVRDHATGEDETAFVLGRMLVQAAKERCAPTDRMAELVSGIYGQPEQPSLT